MQMVNHEFKIVWTSNVYVYLDSTIFEQGQNKHYRSESSSDQSISVQKSARLQQAHPPLSVCLKHVKRSQSYFSHLCFSTKIIVFNIFSIFLMEIGIDSILRGVISTYLQSLMSAAPLHLNGA